MLLARELPTDYKRNRYRSTRRAQSDSILFGSDLAPFKLLLMKLNLRAYSEPDQRPDVLCIAQLSFSRITRA